MIMLEQSVSRRKFLTGCVAGLGAGAFAWLAPVNATRQVHRVDWYAFGTLVEVVVVDDDQHKVNMALLGCRRQ